MKHIFQPIIAAGLVLLSPIMVTAQSGAAVILETKEARDARMAWFQDARFGMFIHWGLYAVPAGEWKGKTNHGEWIMEDARIPVSQYEKFADQFDPVKFDAREWVRVAKDAGMKYIVITSKHHDGFGLWDSKLTDWDIARTPFKRDPLKELADACKEAGITFCFYHSILDWHHPDWGVRRAWHDKAAGKPDMNRYMEYLKGQLKELLTGYGPIGILWFDGEWEGPWTHERGVEVYNFVRGIQPNIIVNNRIGKGRKGMQGMDKGQGVGDYGTPEQEIPAMGFGPGVSWESCMTMNNHWGYNKHDQNWKSTQTLIRNLVDCASKGGNFLLNVGPTAEGLIPAPSVGRLAEIGKWMKANAESIYGTKASPFERLAFGRCTQKPLVGGMTRLYLHVFDQPTDGRLVLPGLTNKPVQAFLLDGGAKLEFARGVNKVTITLPAQLSDRSSTVVALDIEGEPFVCAKTPARAFTPGVIWPDNNGVHINAHGGGVINFEGRYYWYGEHNLPGRSEAQMADGGVHCYSSTDLYNWTDEGVVLPVDNDNPQSDIAAGCILERPKVIYNEATRTFVMFFKSYPKGKGYEYAYVGVATATRPEGPFTYRHRFLGCDSPYGSGDFAIVPDSSGAVYHLAVRKPDKVFCAGKLRDDYLFPAGGYRPVEGIEHHTEAPAIVTRPEGYYLLGSGSTSWKPNAARAFFSTNLTGPYHSLGNPTHGVNPHNGLGPDKTFGGQISFVLPVAGKTNAYIAMFDIWKPELPINGLYVWLPLQFESGKPVIRWQTEWNMEFFGD